MASDTGNRVYFTVNFVLTEIIAPVRKITVRSITELVARLDLVLVCVAICTEGFLMTRTACLTGCSRKEAMFAEEIGRTVVQCGP